MARTGKTPAWVWVAVGCSVAVVLFLVGAGALAFFGVRWARQLEADLEDPAAREEKALQVLGSDELPPGYHAVMALSVPLLMDMAMLSDVEPPPGQLDDLRFDRRGFLYVETLSTGGQRREVEDFFAGEIDQTEFLRRSSINLQRGEVLRRDTVSVHGVEIPFVVQRGSFAIGTGGSRRDGLTTTLLVRCPGDSRLRLGMWFGPDPDPGAPAEELDMAGSTADPQALEEFLSHFRFCGG